MRRSSLIPLMLLTFTIFTFLGFRTANYTGRLAPESQAYTDITQNHRVILIQVDNLDSPKPVLKSIWVGMMFQSQNQSVLSFLPIYPAEDPRNEAKGLARSFNLNRNGKPAAAFMRRLASLGIQQDGYIVADDYALQELAGWINGQGTLFYGSPSQDKTATPGEWFLELGCGSIDETMPQFAWQSLTDHFFTDMSFDDLSAQWKGMVTSDQPLKCELVQN